MTENKRFRFNGYTNCIEYDGKEILLDSYGEDVAELLNELHDETQFFKEECTHQQGQKMRLVAELKRLDYSEDDIRDIANGDVMWND